MKPPPGRVADGKEEQNSRASPHYSLTSRSVPAAVRRSGTGAYQESIDAPRELGQLWRMRFGADPLRGSARDLRCVLLEQTFDGRAGKMTVERFRLAPIASLVDRRRQR